MIYARALEHNLCKNVFMGPAFLWQTQIQTIEYGLKDTILITKKDFALIFFSFTPTDMNFDKNFAKATLDIKIVRIFISEGVNE